METKPSLIRSEFKRLEKEKLKCLEEELAQMQKEITIYNKRNRIDN